MGTKEQKKPEVKVNEVENDPADAPTTPAEAGLDVDVGYQAEVGDWKGDIRTTEERAQAEGDAYLAENYPDEEPEAETEAEQEPEAKSVAKSAA